MLTDYSRKWKGVAQHPSAPGNPRPKGPRTGDFLNSYSNTDPTRPLPEGLHTASHHGCCPHGARPSFGTPPIAFCYPPAVRSVIAHPLVGGTEFRDVFLATLGA